MNADLRDAEFARPDVGERPDWRDEGFRRTSPAAAAAHLSYRPRLPASLPLGFVLSVSGWAPRSPRTGAYERNPAYRDVFAAIYRRGFERIDVTQRLAGRAGWRVDPFRHECATQYRERATVGGAPGRYGIGPDVAPHVYWRRGRVLYTVSGPFPKRDLLAIASSLAPVP